MPPEASGPSQGTKWTILTCLHPVYKIVQESVASFLNNLHGTVSERKIHYQDITDAHPYPIRGA